jgi:hypothetical protein
MNRPSLTFPTPSVRFRNFSVIHRHRVQRATGLYAFAFLLAVGMACAQVITIDTHGAASANGTVDRRYSQIQSTNVPLTQSELDAKTRQELIRVMQSEQGFAMRPFPRGHKGLTIEANGKLIPAGEGYLDMVTQYGMCAKPGDAVVLTDVKIDHNKIIFMINGGPDLKHRFLRHVQLGTSGGMNPVVQNDGQEATGARLTLEFKGHVPELTGAQVKALLAPLISFDVKTPIQAFTDTLPPKLKEAILNHNVMVGMSTDMVLFAKGAPEKKIREVEGQMPFEEWIYGAPPKDVEFVRINGNRVIRVEIAKVGEAPVVFTSDEVEGLMRTDGTPVIAAAGTRTVKMGDVQRNPDTQAPAAPPSLVAPGEQAPDTARTGAGAMKPVQFPTQKPDDYPDVEAARRADAAKAAQATSQDPAKQQTSAAPSDQGSATHAQPASTTPAVNPTPDPAQPH